jgi:hypothetical protein
VHLKPLDPQNAAQPPVPSKDSQKSTRILDFIPLAVVAGGICGPYIPHEALGVQHLWRFAFGVLVPKWAAASCHRLKV